MHRLRTLHLFAGAGGGLLADALTGHTPVCAVEINAYCQQVLSARQNDGHLPWFPIFPDVRKFDGRPWRGLVDAVCGGFPCQDISIAGKGAGIDGERSGLWSEMARIIGEVRPRFVDVENSPKLTRRGLGRVLGDLAALGYDASWMCFGAGDASAEHDRQRIWVAAEMAHPECERCGAQEQRCEAHRPQAYGPTGWTGRPGGWPAEPGMGRMAHGLAHRVDRLKALGNGQVPRVAATALSILRSQCD